MKKYILGACFLFSLIGLAISGETVSRKRTELVNTVKEAPAGGDALELRRGRIAFLNRAKWLVAPLHEKKGEPREGEWLYEFREKGQTFSQYCLDASHEQRTATRKYIYIQPLGGFDSNHKKILRTTAEFIALFYGMPVKLCKEASIEKFPSDAFRYGDRSGSMQLSTDYLLEDVLKPNLPDDAAALIGITTVDLWPGVRWNMNYVFGMTWLYGRVGVISVNRLGDPGESRLAYQQALMRSMKITSHELGHAFSMRHCTCNVCGMNGRKGHFENERLPLQFCQECMAKLCLATGA
ncbi:MAG: hypothetical protein JXR97_16755, partial [Planctomycetes bacterium]|nr:hypothetical protein [Planctomycetota bacterium]